MDGQRAQEGSKGISRRAGATAHLHRPPFNLLNQVLKIGLGDENEGLDRFTDAQSHAIAERNATS